VFALKAARASAALAGRDEVADDDIIAAIQLVLAPRATAIPEAVTPERADSSEGAQSDHQEGEDAEGGLDFAGIEDLMIRAIDVAVPDDVLSVAHRGSRKARSGKRVKSAGSTRGRYVRSSIHQTSQPRVAADATLRAAAPFQLKRGERPAGRARITIEPRDLRFKVLKHRAGMLFIFAVDASGSMAVNRMAQAKGALTRLLQQAYLHRDKVALISFRGESAEVLLSPTRSIELARRLADVLPAGGGTPLSAGVAKAIELAWVARSQGMPQAMLVLLTDGRANVSLAQARTPTDELERLGRVLASEGIESVVIDTKLRFVSAGEAQSLARMLGARYVYLPNSDQRSIYEALRTVITRSTVLDA
jgi:magnesium chelatase subunit D